MKKTAIISLSLLLGACASGEYTTDVSSESYREDFQTTPVTEPLLVEEVAVVEQTVTPTKKPIVVMKEVDVEEKKVVRLSPAENDTTVKIVPPSEQQQAQAAPRFGYTVQVVALGDVNKVKPFAMGLPNNQQPVWSNYKIVNGTKWYTILYGDYATSTEAKQAIAALPKQIQALKPFVKSLDSIKNSAYPTLDKIK